MLTPTPPFAFPPHGRTELRADGARVHVLAEGPFNAEGIDAFSRDIGRLYSALPAGQRFVVIAEVRHSLLGPPEAFERLEAHVRRVAESGMPLLGTCWVVAPAVEARSLMEGRVRALFERAGRRFELVETAAQAEAWANGLLAEADDQGATGGKARR